MSCEAFREILLDFDWDEAARRRAAGLLEHMASCPACREAADDLDRLKALFASNEPDAEPVGGWEAYEQRLTAAIRPRRPAWASRTYAIAASLLLAIVAFQVGWMARQSRTIPSVASIKVPPAINAQRNQPPHFQPQEIVHDVTAFDRVSKFYDGRASWMFVSNDASDVGVANQMLGGANKVLLLRLTMCQGTEIASEADLLIIPGQKADLTVPIKGGHSLHYRIGTSTDEPTRLSLSLEVDTPTASQPVAALSTNLRMEPGQNVTAGQLANSAGEYQLKIAFALHDLPQGNS
jgi:hypothetical protein